MKARGEAAAFVKKQFDQGYMVKGKLVEVTGSLDQEKYVNQQGVTVNAVKILADKVGYGPSDGGNGKNGGNNAASADPGPQMEEAAAPAASSAPAATTQAAPAGAWNPFGG